MPMTEADLKKHLKSEEIKHAYLLYGDEPYLTLFYTNKLIEKLCGKDPDEFGLQYFDGQNAEVSEIFGALEILPFGTDRKVVCVRELDIGKADDKTLKYWEEFLSDLPETGVLIVRLTSVKIDKRTTNLKTFISLFEEYGIAVQFPQQEEKDCVRLLVAGAKKRGNDLPSSVAEVLVERCGTDLYRLVNELDKLCAVAGDGPITKDMVQTSTVESLEARVFDLSKMIMQSNASRAFSILQTLKGDKEKPVAVLAVLSNAYADLYRVKVAKDSGVAPESLAQSFNYKRREFVLQNAARDVARMSIASLRESLEALAKADIAMKSSSVDSWLILDETVTNLLAIRRG
ncbi:MAG: DNA polymerase III subunit delta [Clostridia bacterium]|nr:DNA polymerase III subunit delta [Clostridia bacterium]